MVLKLDKVVPFGRSFDEYIKMFNLSTHDLQKRILGVGDGPASFNAEGTQLGYDITSIDPIYQFNRQHILFLYSDHYDYQFHLESILEMLRISSEVRIFPLLTLMLEKSPYLPLMQQDLTAKGYQISVVKTAYEFQKGGNEMLVIKSS